MKFLSLTFLSACLIYSSDREQTDQTIYKISRNNDSIVLSGSAPFYHKLQIFHKQKKVLDYANEEFEVLGVDNSGNESNWFTEHYDKGYLYIIRVFNAPRPDRFLVIKTTDTNTVILGITEPSSAEIFGDVDYDGKFEIGGQNAWCQGGDNNCHPEDYYRVFEIAPNFPTDIALTNFFKQFLKKE